MGNGRNIDNICGLKIFFYFWEFSHLGVFSIFGINVFFILSFILFYHEFFFLENFAFWGGIKVKAVFGNIKSVKRKKLQTAIYSSFYWKLYHHTNQIIVLICQLTKSKNCDKVKNHQMFVHMVGPKLQVRQNTKICYNFYMDLTRYYGNAKSIGKIFESIVHHMWFDSSKVRCLLARLFVGKCRVEKKRLVEKWIH